MEAQAADRPDALAQEALVVPDDAQDLSIHVEDLARQGRLQAMSKPCCRSSDMQYLVVLLKSSLQPSVIQMQGRATDWHAKPC